MLKGFTLPNYKASTVNIISSVLHHFGILPSHPPFKPIQRQARGADKIVFFFVDGLGFHQVKQLPKNSFLRQRMQPKPITAVFPSTTSASVASFATGLTPLEHGILGYMLYLPDYKVVTDMLQYRNIKTKKKIRVNPCKFFPFPTVYQQLKKSGVRSFMIGPAYLRNTTFSKMVNKGSTYVPYRSVPELFKKLRKLLARPGKAYVQCYIPDYDSVCHEYGPNGIIPTLYASYLNNLFARFITNKFRKTLLVISADHGHIKTDPAKTIIYAKHSRLRKNLKAIAGEARINYLHCKKDKQAFVQEYFKHNLKNTCQLITSREAFAQGLFGTGTPHPQARERIGDFVVLCTKNKTMLERPVPLIGHHGGLSKQEMHVPLILHRFKY